MFCNQFSLTLYFLVTIHAMSVNDGFLGLVLAVTNNGAVNTVRCLKLIHQTRINGQVDVASKSRTRLVCI